MAASAADGADDSVLEEGTAALGVALSGAAEESKFEVIFLHVTFKCINLYAGQLAVMMNI